MNRTDVRDPETWVPRDLFAAYCGPGSEKLLAYYDKARAKRNLMVFSFDWLAVLALPAWLAYRRQWAMWGTLVVVIALASIAEVVAHFELPAAAFGGPLLAMGLMGQGLLLTEANGRYLKLKRQGLDDAAIRSALAGKASPSAGLAFAGLFGALAIQAAVVLLLPT